MANSSKQDATQANRWSDPAVKLCREKRQKPDLIIQIGTCYKNYEDDELDLETCKYILDIIGDKFCQLVTSEKTAMSWVKKDGKELSDSVFSVFRSFIEVLVLAMTCCLLLSTCFVWGYVGKGQEPSSAGCGAAGSSPQGRRPPSASTLPAQLSWDEMYPAGSKVKTQLSFLGS